MTEEASIMPIRVMLVEDRTDFRDLMEIVLNSQPDIKVVAQAKSLAEARDHAAGFDLDVAVLDLGLPDGNGADLIADVRRTNPDVKVLILSASLDADNFRRATESGADEIMDKLAPVEEVLDTIRCLANT